MKKRREWMDLAIWRCREGGVRPDRANLDGTGMELGTGKRGVAQIPKFVEASERASSLWCCPFLFLSLSLIQIQYQIPHCSSSSASLHAALSFYFLVVGFSAAECRVLWMMEACSRGSASKGGRAASFRVSVWYAWYVPDLPTASGKKKLAQLRKWKWPVSQTQSGTQQPAACFPVTNWPPTCSLL